MVLETINLVALGKITWNNVYIEFSYVCHFFQKLGAVYMKPGTGYQADGTIDQIRQMQSFVHEFIITFRWSQDVFHRVPAKWDPACSKRDPGIAGTIYSV